MLPIPFAISYKTVQAASFILDVEGKISRTHSFHLSDLNLPSRSCDLLPSAICRVIWWIVSKLENLIYMFIFRTTKFITVQFFIWINIFETVMKQKWSRLFFNRKTIQVLNFLRNKFSLLFRYYDVILYDIRKAMTCPKRTIPLL